MASHLLKHGYMILPDGKTVPKPFRPKTLAEARKAIESVFDKNQWDERSRLKYFELHGIEPKQLKDASIEEVRVILAAMQKSKMILFQD